MDYCRWLVDGKCTCPSVIREGKILDSTLVCGRVMHGIPMSDLCNHYMVQTGPLGLAR